MKIKNETRIGIFVAICAVILFALTWKAGKFDFAPRGYEIIVQFKDIDGISVNAPVHLNGMEVGRVSDINIIYGDITRVDVHLWLRANAKLHQGAKAAIKNLGFMGEKLVALTSGEDGTAFLPPGTMLIGEEPADFQKILADGQAIAGNLKSISAQIDERLKVNSKAIDDAIQNFAAITVNVNERLQVNKEKIDMMAASLSVASRNLEDMSCDLKANPWKLLYRPRKGECPKLK